MHILRIFGGRKNSLRGQETAFQIRILIFTTRQAPFKYVCILPQSCDPETQQFRIVVIIIGVHQLRSFRKFLSSQLSQVELKCIITPNDPSQVLQCLPHVYIMQLGPENRGGRSDERRTSIFSEARYSQYVDTQKNALQKSREALATIGAYIRKEGRDKNSTSSSLFTSFYLVSCISILVIQSII